VVRYERAAPGDLIHIDTKKLGWIDGISHRITGNRRGQRKGIGCDMDKVPAFSPILERVPRRSTAPPSP
jgi:hypothetical protein